MGVSCAFCHAIIDGPVYSMPKGGSIGKQIDGPTPHFLNVGATFAIAANTRALYPIAQLALAANKGKTIGRAPTGLTESSTEAEIDAYFSNPAFYPVGMFDDAFDGNGAPMHITPMFRADLAAPWGSEAAISKLDNFSNLVYTGLLDLTGITTPRGPCVPAQAGGSRRQRDRRKLREDSGRDQRHRLSLRADLDEAESGRRAGTARSPGRPQEAD